jgi:hypothetical protein
MGTCVSGVLGLKVLPDYYFVYSLVLDHYAQENRGRARLIAIAKFIATNYAMRVVFVHRLRAVFTSSSARTEAASLRWMELV